MNAGVLTPIAERIQTLDWRHIGADLDAHGCAVVDGLLTGDECTSLTDSYAAGPPFRSRVVMAQHGFGRGEYKYFAYPLPDIVAAIRTNLYPPLAEIANRWNSAIRPRDALPRRPCNVSRTL